MKIWITKYALTSTGIIECEGDTRHCDDGDIRARDRDGKFTVTYREYDWHTTEEQALERVLDMIEEEATRCNKRLEDMKRHYTECIRRINDLYRENG